MRVEKLHRQVFFDGISSKLRMCKTSAVGMLFAEFYFRFNGFKQMNIKSNATSYYQFSSCLRRYLLDKPPIRHPKTVQKALRDVPTSCKRTRGGKRITTNSIAACARKHGARCQFDSQKLVLKRLQTSSADIFKTIKHHAEG